MYKNFAASGGFFAKWEEKEATVGPWVPMRSSSMYRCTCIFVSQAFAEESTRSDSLAPKASFGLLGRYREAVLR